MNKLESKFDTVSFSKKIEEMVKFQNMDYLEAVMHFCDENGLEVEAGATLVKRSEPIRQKIEAQARASRVLGRGPVGANLDAFVESA